MEMTEAQELYLRNQTIEKAVSLLNAFGFFLQAETPSPEEDQWDAEVANQISDLIKDGEGGLGGHVILALMSMIHSCADPERIQNYLDEQGRDMMEKAQELRSGD